MGAFLLALLDPLVVHGAKWPVLSSIVVAAFGATLFGGAWLLLVDKYQRDHPAPAPPQALVLDAGPFRLDQFEFPRGSMWLFHQFTVRVQHPKPDMLGDLRAEITAMEPHNTLDASLPIPLRIHRVGIHDAIVDVFRVGSNDLDEGPIQWSGQALFLYPPDPIRLDGKREPQALLGLSPRKRYVLTITVAAGGLSTSRKFTLVPNRPSYEFTEAK
jgi:hypothetical protein